MNKYDLEKFRQFLLKEKYKTRTIELYLQYITKYIDHLPYEKQRLYEHIKILLDSEQHKYTESQFHCLRAGFYQYFHWKTRITVKEYLNELINPLVEYPILNGFDTYCNSFLKVQEETTKQEIQTIVRILPKLQSLCSGDFQLLTLKKILGFCKTEFKTLNPSSIRMYVTRLRRFFKFLEYKGIQISPNLENLKISSAFWKQSTIPIILKDEELNRLQNRFNDDSEKSVRNKAILQIFIDEGLRTSEISKLALSDILWNSGEIIIRNTKNRNDRRIPLSVRAGKALEKYVLKYRLKYKAESLFVNAEYNIGSPMKTEDIRRMIRKLFREEEITGRWKGPHSFRRTMASKIFNAGNGMKLTADILGHAVISSTTHYVKVDFESMSKIAGNWPMEGDRQ